MQETKRIYKLADNIHKLLKNKWTYIVLIGLFVSMTVIQMILFGTGVIKYNNMTVNDAQAWTAWASLTLLMVGTSVGAVGGSRSARRRKDFYWLTVFAFAMYTINSIMLGIYLDATKTFIMIGFFTYQRYIWNKEKHDHIQPKSLAWKYSVPLFLAAITIGLLVGWGVLQAPNVRYAYDFLAYLDGMQLVVGLYIIWLTANKYKEGYVFGLFNTVVVFTIFVFIGSPVSMLNIAFFGLTNIYGAISWHKHLNDNK